MKNKEGKNKNKASQIFHSFMHQSPVSTEIYDLDGNLLEANSAFINLFGINELILNELYKKYNVLQDEQIIELGLMPYVNRVYGGETVIFPEFNYNVNQNLTSLGIKKCMPKQRWATTQGYPIKDEKGNVTHVVFTSEDITEKKLAEQELQDTRLFTDNLIKSANMMIIGIDEEGKVNIFNPAAERVTGYTFEEIKNKDWFETLVPKERFSEVHEEFKRLLAGGIPKTFENRIITKNGDERFISWANNEIIKNDNYSGIISFGVDITNQKKAKEQILLSEAKFRTLFYEAGYAMSMSKGSNGILVEVNWEWLKLFDFDHPNEVLGTSVVEYVIEADKSKAAERALKSSKGEYVNKKTVFTGVRKDKTTFLMEIKMSRFKMDGETITLAIIIDVTERKKVEEEKNRIFNLSNDLIGVVGFDHIIKQINPALENILGYTVEELIGKSYLNLLHPDDVQQTLDYIEERKQGEDTPIREFENRYIHKDGTVREMSWTTTVAIEEESIYAIGRDITERKKAEKALIESEEKYRNLIEHLTDGVIVVQDDIIKFSNPAISDLTGYTQGELLGEEFVEFINLDEAPQVVEKYNERDLGGEWSPYDIRLKLKNGNSIDIECIATPSSFLGEEAILVVARDISERKKAVEAIKESEEKFRLLVEQSPLAILIFNPDGSLDQVNEAWQKMWGISDEDLQKVLAYYNILTDVESDKTGQLPLIHKAFNGEPVTLPLVEYNGKDAMDKVGQDVNVTSIWSQTRCYPVKNKNGEVLKVVNTVEDHTHRKLLELEALNYQQKLKDLAIELTYAEEKQRKQIATDLHDDVGQLLASSRMQIAAIKRDFDKEKILEKVKDVSSGLLNAIKATRQAIFDLSPPQLNEIGLEAALADWVEEEMENKYEIKTIFNGEDRLYNLSSEIRYLLFRCTRELLLNIVKHASATEVIVVISEKDKILKISVEDNGVGFNNAVDDKSIKTAGFGLFSIQERIQNIGGSVEIQSSKGRGTKIIVYLPI